MSKFNQLFESMINEMRWGDGYTFWFESILNAKNGDTIYQATKNGLDVEVTEYVLEDLQFNRNSDFKRVRSVKMTITNKKTNKTEKINLKKAKTHDPPYAAESGLIDLSDKIRRSEVTYLRTLEYLINRDSLKSKDGNVEDVRNEGLDWYMEAMQHGGYDISNMTVKNAVKLILNNLKELDKTREKYLGYTWSPAVGGIDYRKVKP